MNINILKIQELISEYISEYIANYKDKKNVQSIDIFSEVLDMCITNELNILTYFKMICDEIERNNIYPIDDLIYQQKFNNMSIVDVLIENNSYCVFEVYEMLIRLENNLSEKHNIFTKEIVLFQKYFSDHYINTIYFLIRNLIDKEIVLPMLENILIKNPINCLLHKTKLKYCLQYVQIHDTKYKYPSIEHGYLNDIVPAKRIYYSKPDTLVNRIKGKCSHKILEFLYSITSNNSTLSDTDDELINEFIKVE